MYEKMKKIETEKIQKLLNAAQQDLDSAKESKAPRSTIEFLNQRIKALENKLAKWKKHSEVKEVERVEEQEKESVAEKSDKKKDKASKR